MVGSMPETLTRMALVWYYADALNCFLSVRLSWDYLKEICKWCSELSLRVPLHLPRQDVIIDGVGGSHVEYVEKGKKKVLRFTDMPVAPSLLRGRKFSTIQLMGWFEVGMYMLVRGRLPLEEVCNGIKQALWVVENGQAKLEQWWTQEKVGEERIESFLEQVRKWAEAGIEIEPAFPAKGVKR